MRKAFVRTSMIVALTVMTVGLASAQIPVTLPDFEPVHNSHGEDAANSIHVGQEVLDCLS